jgi:adenosylcobinamide-phosphate synthase
MSFARTRPVALGLAMGLVADEVIGDPRSHHPVAAFGRVAERLESCLWRPSRLAGTAYVITLVIPIASAIGLLDAAAKRRPKVRLLLTAIVVWTVVGGRSLRREARRLAVALDQGDVMEARVVARSLVGRDPMDLDESELSRAAIESVAENTADAVVGPVLWGALAGPAGAVAYRAINTLDAMVGYRDHRYERFGWAAARLDDLVTWPAARLAALLSVLVAFAAGGNGARAFAVWRADGGNHPSPNAGQLEAAFAGALGVTLGGANRYGDRLDSRPLIGSGPRPGFEHVRDAARISRLIGAATLAACFLLAIGKDR